jgi:hypothetical protein
MEIFSLGALIDGFKRVILWVIVSIIFTTAELKDEASRHICSGVVRIPGVCYGSNLVQGYRAIGKYFPQRCGAVRLDFILGYCKSLLLAACIVGLFLLVARLVT